MTVKKSGDLQYTARAFKQDSEDAMKGDVVRALIELITNADDAYNSKGGAIHIRLLKSERPFQAKISVHDKATGLDADGLENAFARLGDINQKFVDYIFSVFGKTENTINWMVFKDPSSLEFMGELSDEIQKNIISFNPIAIRYLKNPSEQLKLSAVIQNGLMIQHFENPSESLQRAAINSNYQALNFINDPSETLQMAAIKRFGSTKYDVISFIKNPTENAKLEAVNQNGYAIQFIDNPSEAVQIAAVKNKEQSYFYIKNPTDNVKRLVGVDESRKKIRNILRG
jgi:hypothetical protein